MNYDELHDQAMDLDDEAFGLTREGNKKEAAKRLRAAAELEEQAADLVPEEKPRTRGILRRSAVALWWQAGDWGRVVEVGERYLSESLLPGFAENIRRAVEEAREKMKK